MIQNFSSRMIDSRTGEGIDLAEAIQTSQPLSGGLWTPYFFPRFDQDDLSSMSDLNYQELAFRILRRFDFGISPDSLKSVISQAYGTQWHNPDITPVKEIDTDLYSLHLGYGPTFAFKNIALEFLPRLLAAMTTDKVALVLGASSGDTINAANYGVQGTNISSLFLLPNTGPSAVQRLQAVHGIVSNPNALTILADAPFDPLQDVIKKVNGAGFEGFKEQHNITSFNSINIARILAQVVYYFRAYSQLVRKGKISAGDEVNFSVPSGNFGDALAGLYAREMGLPIRKINVATNENSMLHTFFQTGIYEPPKLDGKDFVQVTNAPSQDIAKSSNFERALYWATNGDAEKIKTWYKDGADTGRFQVDSSTLSRLKEVFTSSTSDDVQRLDAIKQMAEKSQHGIDPHSATGVVPILQGQFGLDVPTIFLETSHVAQFSDELKARGIIVPGMDDFDDIIQKMQSKHPVEGEHFLKSAGDFDALFRAVREGIDILHTRK